MKLWKQSRTSRRRAIWSFERMESWRMGYNTGECHTSLYGRTSMQTMLVFLRGWRLSARSVSSSSLKHIREWALRSTSAGQRSSANLPSTATQSPPAVNVHSGRLNMDHFLYLSSHFSESNYDGILHCHQCTSTPFICWGKGYLKRKTSNPTQISWSTRKGWSALLLCPWDLKYLPTSMSSPRHQHWRPSYIAWASFVCLTLSSKT